MSLFPAYSAPEAPSASSDNKTPAWLTNLSFQDFERRGTEASEKKDEAVEISSDSEEDPLIAAKAIVIEDTEDEKEDMDKFIKEKLKREKKKLTLKPN